MHSPRIWQIVLVVLFTWMAPQAWSQTPAADREIRLDLEHILQGQINRQGKLVGLHHVPSAPREIKIGNRVCLVEIKQTSPGGPNDVVSVRIVLRDKETREFVQEKASTCYPSAWTRVQIEKAIREAFADARKRGEIDEDTRWGGRSADGHRIEGYLSRDRKEITTAFPIRSVRPGGEKP